MHLGHSESRHAAEENEEHRREAYCGDGAEDHHGENRTQDQNGEAVLFHAAEHFQSGGQNEVYDTHLNPAEGTGNKGEREETVEEQRDAVDDKKGRNADGNGRGRRTGKTGEPVADKGGAVDGHGARCGFRDGDHVEELVTCEPLLFLNEFALKKSDHGVAAAEGEGTDFQEGEK